MFKGNTRAVFVDKREYTGPLCQQIEDAFQFVLRINLYRMVEEEGLSILQTDLTKLPTKLTKILTKLSTKSVQKQIDQMQSLQIRIKLFFCS